MTSLKSFAWDTASAGPRWTHPVRQLAASSLHLGSALLAHLARRIEVPAVPLPELPLGIVEFHADGSAPEGALYINGELVGWIEGVRRL